MFGLSIAIVPSIFNTHNSTSTEATQTPTNLGAVVGLAEILSA